MFKITTEENFDILKQLVKAKFSLLGPANAVCFFSWTPGIYSSYIQRDLVFPCYDIF